MHVTVNGRPRVVDQRTVAELLATGGHDLARPGIAVAVNGVVVPRSAWHTRQLAEGDAVEVLGAAQGG